MDKKIYFNQLNRAEQRKAAAEWERFSAKQELVYQIGKYCKNRTHGCDDTCRICPNLDAALADKAVSVYTHSTLIGYFKIAAVAFYAAIRKKKVYYLTIER